jgi:hypothetical protein
MKRIALPGATVLLAAPLVAAVGALVQPTLSDSAAAQVSALSDHRAATIAAAVLNATAITLLIAGIIWLALALAPRAPRLSLAGGCLGVLGSLIVLFETGLAASAPTIVRALDGRQATATLDRIHASAAASALEPLSLAGDIGLALLGLALVRAGAPRWTATAIAVGAFAEGAGFATGTRVAVLVGFALLFGGLAFAVGKVVPQGWINSSVRPQRS